LKSAKVRLPNNCCSWTILDNDGYIIGDLQDWIIHLEETNASPNSIKAYVRHVVRLGNYLQSKNKTFADITIADFDYFLRWAPWTSNKEAFTSNVIALSQDSPLKLSASLKNQIIIATKCFYSYLTNCNHFNFMQKNKNKYYEGNAAYKPFLEHINLRQHIRRKEKYLSGDIALA